MRITNSSTLRSQIIATFQPPLAAPARYIAEVDLQSCQREKLVEDPGRQRLQQIVTKVTFLIMFRGRIEVTAHRRSVSPRYGVNGPARQLWLDSVKLGNAYRSEHRLCSSPPAV